MRGVDFPFSQKSPHPKKGPMFTHLPAERLETGGKPGVGGVLKWSTESRHGLWEVQLESPWI